MSIFGTMGLTNIQTLGVQGWTHFAKSNSGSAAVYNNTAAISAGSLNTYNNASDVDAKLSDTDIKAILKSGYHFGYILVFASNVNPVLLRWTHALIDAWSAGHRWGSTGNGGSSARNDDGMWYYNTDAKSWVQANGHYNNYFISTYNDLDSPGCMGLNGTKYYYNFHSNSSYQSAGDYSFFGKGV
tara:strand:+ start:26 stop:580 length:555 start_codon:yes stop_codon:yes gene_type:complete